jgi:hypothetical protein
VFVIKTGGVMSEKNRLKKDGSDKNKENQARREAQANPEVKRAFSAHQPKENPPTGNANRSAPKRQD